MSNDSIIGKNYRYVTRGYGEDARTELFRFPKNDLHVTRQPISAFERLHKDGTWGREPLNSEFFNELVTGWVTGADEIDPDAAIKLVEKWRREGWPGRV